MLTHQTYLLSPFLEPFTMLAVLNSNIFIMTPTTQIRTQVCSARTCWQCVFRKERDANLGHGFRFGNQLKA